MDRRSRTAVVARVVAALTLTAALAACGPQGPSGPAEGSTPPSGGDASTTARDAVAPHELLRLAVGNTIDAPSKRLVGSTAVPGTSQEFDIIYVDEDARGSLTARAVGLESVIEFIRVGDSLYILAIEAYWYNYVPLEGLAQVSGKWVRVAADHPSHETLLVPMDATELSRRATEVVQVDTDRIDGTPAVVLEDPDGNRFFVSAEGTPYLLRVEATQETEIGEATVELTYSQIGEVTESIAAPSGEIVDLR